MNLTPKLAAGFALVCLTGSEVVACEFEYEKAPETDSAQFEVDQLRDRVLRRCGLSSKLADNKLPWYFYYEFGVELLNHGQAGLAVEPLQMTANLRSEPSRAARMYGMWYVNYLPYYQMSLAFSQLEEWDKAWDAITMSEQLVEFSPGDVNYESFSSLKALIEGKRQSKS